MIKPLFFTFLFLCSLQSYSQKLVYNSNGNILNSENQKISPNQVRALLANNEKLLADYNAGRSKKTAGNILLYGGLGMFLTSSMIPLYNGKPVSIALPIVGLASIIIAIPVKIGFSKKIKNVVTDYNNQLTTGNVNFDEPKLNLIANSNGIGFRLTLN